jgi:hypothetical protein
MGGSAEKKKEKRIGGKKRKPGRKNGEEKRNREENRQEKKKEKQRGENSPGLARKQRKGKKGTARKTSATVCETVAEAICNIPPIID